jgi:hypothetical protein
MDRSSYLKILYTVLKVPFYCFDGVRLCLCGTAAVNGPIVHPTDGTKSEYGAGGQYADNLPLHLSFAVRHIFAIGQSSLTVLTVCVQTFNSLNPGGKYMSHLLQNQ